MFPIDVPSATPDNKFTEGSPTGGVPATVVSADWLNTIQAELLNIVTNAGLTPSKTTDTQVLTAILSLVLGTGGTGINDFIKLKFRDKTTGALRELILQWGTTPTTDGSGFSSTPLALVFPNAQIGGVIIFQNGSRQNVVTQLASLTTTDIQWFATNGATGGPVSGAIAKYLCVGY